MNVKSGLFLRMVSACLLVLLFASMPLSSRVKHTPHHETDDVGPVGVLRTGPIPAYVEHGAINIGSDAQFSWQGWPGSGTEADPYVIEGFNITTSSGS
ncbi:MAG: hypothetical protein ACP6IT_09065, partial [Candidatus Thorarchaeota archaeon]